jgi:hypothetical protein
LPPHAFSLKVSIMPEKDAKEKVMRRADALFAANEVRDASLREELAAAKSKNLAKIAQLKALRIARDAEQTAADRAKPEKQGVRIKKPRLGNQKYLRSYRLRQLSDR